jgi:hypothetical protein
MTERSCSSVSGSTEQDTAPSERVEAWNRLLVTRPPKDDQEAFTKWMEEILMVSSRHTVDHHCTRDIPAMLASLLK